MGKGSGHVFYVCQVVQGQVCRPQERVVDQEGKGYTYFIDNGDSPKGVPMLEGFYVCGKTVLTFKTMSEETDLIDDLCDAFKEQHAVSLTAKRPIAEREKP